MAPTRTVLGGSCSASVPRSSRSRRSSARSSSPRAICPDPINISWTASGQPSNPATLGRFAGVQATLAALCSLGFVLGALRVFGRPITNGMVATIAGAVAPVLAVNTISTLRVNEGAATWTEAQAPGVAWMIVTLAAVAAGMAATGWLVRDLLVGATGGPMGRPSAGLVLTPTTRASWHSTASARWPMMVGVLAGAVGLVVLASSAVLAGSIGIVIGVAILVVAAATLAFATIRVDVDRRGVTVAYGWLGWPTSHVAIDKITGADAIVVDPRDHGGWGYRGSRRLLKRAAIVIRRGEGLRLSLVDGTEFVRDRRRCRARRGCAQRSPRRQRHALSRPSTGPEEEPVGNVMPDQESVLASRPASSSSSSPVRAGVISSCVLAGSGARTALTSADFTDRLSRGRRLEGHRAGAGVGGDEAEPDHLRQAAAGGRDRRHHRGLSELHPSGIAFRVDVDDVTGEHLPDAWLQHHRLGEIDHRPARAPTLVGGPGP